MGLYRQYKNGLYAKKYKDYYIVPPEDNTNRVWTIYNSALEIRKTGIAGYYDAVWEVDKLAATEEETLAIEQLYQKSMPELEVLMQRLSSQRETDGLSVAEEKVMDFTRKVLNRKRAGQPL